jgi:hypothetical protein
MSDEKGAAEEPKREEPDKLLRIAGLVNGYHNDGTKLSAAETLAAIADVLGDPFDFSSSAVVVGADQQLKEAINKLNVVIQSLHELERRPDDRDANSVWTWRLDVVADELIAIRDALFNAPALPDPGLPERIWCTGCKAIRPLLRDPLGYGVTDLVCGQCHLIAATLHPPEREK